MKYFFIIFLLLSCRHETSEVIPPDDLAMEFSKRVERFDINSITRCDKITFASLLDAFGKKIDLFKFEYPEGKWNRDLLPCYPEDSDSETSRDGYLGVLHALWTRQDKAALERILSYAEPQGGTTGRGPEGVQNIWPLLPTIHEMASHIRFDGESDQLPFLEGFRGHLIGVYILLRGRLHGSIGPLELKFAEKLRDQEPQSPFYQALVHRFTDGNQTDAQNLLRAMPTKDAPFGWGSCPNDIYWILSYATMKGL